MNQRELYQYAKTGLVRYIEELEKDVEWLDAQIHKGSSKKDVAGGNGSGAAASRSPVMDRVVEVLTAAFPHDLPLSELETRVGRRVYSNTIKAALEHQFIERTGVGRYRARATPVELQASR